MRKYLTAMLVSVGLLLFGTPSAQATLVDDIDQLEVAAEERAGYDRDKFGDYDRDAVLETNLAAYPSCDGYYSVADDRCYALADFGGDPEAADDEVDIDHIVALGEAWDSGASTWTDDQRDDYAADADNLWVMTDNLNQSKGDGDIAEWQPPHDPAVCGYVEAYVAVKLSYDLAVDQAELAALTTLGTDCEPTNQTDPTDGESTDEPSKEPSEELGDDETSASVATAGSTGDELADTGVGVLSLALGATGLIGSGAGLLWAKRRRPHGTYRAG